MSLDRRFLDVSLNVKGIANEPAASPVAGTQYIVGASPTGAFSSASANDLARYDGSKWKFTRPGTGQMEVLNLETAEVLGWNGTEWTILARIRGENPVLDVVATGTALPATAEEGDKFLNTSDGKVYAATAENTWDSGTATSSGDRYASSTDAKIYENRAGVIVSTSLADGTLFLSKADGSPYGYDSATNSLVKMGGEIGVEIVTESHVLTAAEATAKSFNLSYDVAAGKETSVLLAVCGVTQTAGTDFTVSGKVVSWTDKGLADVDLAAGDTFVIQYQKKA